MADPYAELEAHIISVKALYCEGCGLVETSGYGEDKDAARELAPRWRIRESPLGGLSPFCRECASRRDQEAGTVDEFSNITGDEAMRYGWTT